jgi:hypothetical protein
VSGCAVDLLIMRLIRVWNFRVLCGYGEGNWGMGL